MADPRPSVLTTAWRFNARLMQLVSIVLALVCLSSLVRGVAAAVRTGDWSHFVGTQWLASLFLVIAACIFLIAHRFASVGAR